MASGVTRTAYKYEAPTVAYKFRSQVGNAEDYSWITGQMFRIQGARGSVWVVRYAPAEQVDKYSGCMVLSTRADLKAFRDGDLVCVEGEVMNGQPVPGHLGGAVYHAKSVALIKRDTK
jgi:hypothetical protein